MSLSQRRNFRHKFVFAEGSTEYGPVPRPTSEEGRQSPPSKRRRTDEKVEEKVKAEEESDEESTKEEENRQRWPNVREKFFLYTPAEVSAISDIDVLHKVQDLYRPSAQPHTEEEHKYIDLVAKAADARLIVLKCGCYSCGIVWGE